MMWGITENMSEWICVSNKRQNIRFMKAAHTKNIVQGKIPKISSPPQKKIREEFCPEVTMTAFPQHVGSKNWSDGLKENVLAWQTTAPQQRKDFSVR